MRYLYENELRKYMTQSKEDVLTYAETLVSSHNATSYQMANELSSMMRAERRYDEATEIARMMFEENPSLDQLNLYFVAVADQGDISRIQRLSALTEQFLKDERVTYQKHLFATWLKAANKILDDSMFQHVYSQVPAEEKQRNSYIISQYYVYRNRHSQYEDVCKHYDNLEPHIQNSLYVKRYYENARRRLGYPVSNAVDTTRAVNVIAGNGVPAAFDKEPAQQKEKKERTVFVIYGGQPSEIQYLKMMLDYNKVPYVILAKEVKTGETIIEAFERFASQADFAIALCTPEDEMKNGQWYVRQNVIFECGFFMARLGRKNVVLLNKRNNKEMELPSDFSNIYQIRMDNNDWMSELGCALKAAGFSLINT